MWRLGNEVFAEVAVPEVAGVKVGGFGIHPVLLDASLHAMGVAGEETETMLPFSWQGVCLHAAGASRARVRIAPVGVGAVSVDLADGTGLPILSVRELVVRPVSTAQLSAAGPRVGGGLLEVAWSPVSLEPNGIAGDGMVVWEPSPGADGVVGSVYAATHEVLGVLQSWLAGDGSGVLVVLTRGAVGLAGEDVTDLAGAAVWGLVRSAQAEHPGRVVLVDSDGSIEVGTVIGCGEPQLVVRSGVAHAARLTSVGAGSALELPAGAWQITAGRGGTLEDLVVQSCPRAELAAGQVRVAVAAVGVNFRDVLVALGMYPGGGELGVEGAGVVVEVGPGVQGLAVGDAVLGLFGLVGSEAVVDARLVTAVPAGWSLVRAASVPVVFLTAWYGLSVLASLKAGEKVLVHAATGGVGMAAVQLARHWGAEVFATASRGKWDTLRAMGFDDDHIGDSRSLEFEEKFLAATDGAGVDVVLNSLAGEFVDASLRLLARRWAFYRNGQNRPSRPRGSGGPASRSAVPGIRPDRGRTRRHRDHAGRVDGVVCGWGVGAVAGQDVRCAVRLRGVSVCQPGPPDRQGRAHRPRRARRRGAGWLGWWPGRRQRGDHRGYRDGRFCAGRSPGRPLWGGPCGVGQPQRCRGGGCRGVGGPARRRPGRRCRWWPVMWPIAMRWRR